MSENIVVFWDGGRSAKRMELYPGYKAGRKIENPTPEELHEKEVFWLQVEAVSRGLALRQVRNVKVPGTEADDLISIYAHGLQEDGHEVVVFTGDKDLQQICSSRISIFHPEKELLSEAAILEKWGLRSISDIVRFRAIVGDSSDAIDGVPTVGEKRALLVMPYWDRIFDGSLLSDLGVAEKWVAKCREHVSTIRRNLQLSILPRTWNESFYGIAEALDMAKQTDETARVNDFPAFVRFCNEWEIESLDMSAW